MDAFSIEWINSIFSKHGKSNNTIVMGVLQFLNFKKNFKIINVVGTNGKGSTTQYINDALVSDGYKVGKFTSPHILRFNERITINDKEISNDDYFKITNSYINIYDDKLMFFQIMFITAMKYFEENNVDFVILEAGIGGVKDPTSVIDGDYGVLTSLGRDHIEIFGTEDNIAVDKAGVSNKGMEFFVPSSLTKKQTKLVLQTLKENEANINIVNNAAKTYDKRNQAMANAVYKSITDKEIDSFNIPFGRTSQISKNGHNVILDVAHNEDGIKASLEKMKYDGIEYDQVVISLSNNKEDENIGDLFDKPIYLYEHKGHAPKKIEDFKIQGTEIKDLKEFFENTERSTLYIGSFYLLHDLLQHVK